MRFLSWLNIVVVIATIVFFIYGIGAGTLRADFIVWWWAFTGLIFSLFDTIKSLATDH